MPNLFKIREMLFSAEYERQYLANLIESLQENLFNHPEIKIPDSRSKFLEDYIESIQEFRIRFSNELDHLTVIYQDATDDNGNLIDETKNKFMEYIENRCNILSGDFRKIHSKFIEEIDIDFSGYIAMYQAQLNATHSFAEKYLNNSENTENSSAIINQDDENKHIKTTSKKNNKTTRLKDTIEYLNDICRPLSLELGELQFDSSVSPDYDKLSIEVSDVCMKEYLEDYLNNLERFHDHVIDKLLFQYNPKALRENCELVLKITGNYKHGLFDLSKQNNLKKAFKFVIKNCHFFIAPYIHFDEFQIWAKNHADLLTPLSNGLLKYMPSRDQSSSFKQGLKQYIDSGKHDLLEWFLSHSNSDDLTRFLAKIMAEKNVIEIIDKWHQDHPKQSVNKLFSSSM